MKKLIRSLLAVSAVALALAACTTATNPRLASAERRSAAGAGTPGYIMPPAEHVDTSEGGGLILHMQRSAAGNAHD